LKSVFNAEIITNEAYSIFSSKGLAAIYAFK
jgi:hypothetical protein